MTLHNFMLIFFKHARFQSEVSRGTRRGNKAVRREDKEDRDMSLVWPKDKLSSSVREGVTTLAQKCTSFTV